MAAAMTATPPMGAEAGVAWTISITGATATTAYYVEVNGPIGRILLPVTTDGSGAGTVSYVPQSGGTFTASLRPVAEYQGTTTAAATLLSTSINDFN